MVTDIDRVAVVDGNTLRLADRVIRLDGVIPPARGQTCLARDGVAFDCGVAAANALAAMLRNGPVDCTLSGADRNGRPVATCSAGGQQLNRAVVAAGWARAADETLLAAEQRARAEQLGLWAMVR
jgi:endonuclease YncB( thermonuclease family)